MNREQRKAMKALKQRRKHQEWRRARNVQKELAYKQIKIMRAKEEEQKGKIREIMREKVSNPQLREQMGL